MPADAIYCAACLWPLPPESWRQAEPIPCPGCRKTLRATLFPAATRSSRTASLESIVEAGEASCFYHAQSRAVTPCEDCGRFLCALCELEVAGRRVCPTCLESSLRGGESQNLETSRTLYDSIALSLATLPAMLIWPAFFSAPVALYYSIRYWKKPGSIVPRSRIRLYLAVIFSVVELAGVAAMIVLMVIGFRQGRT